MFIRQLTFRYIHIQNHSMWQRYFFSVLNPMAFILNLIIVATLSKSRYIFSFQNVITILYFICQAFYSMTYFITIDCSILGSVSYFIRSMIQIELVMISLAQSKGSTVIHISMALIIAALRTAVPIGLSNATSPWQLAKICALGPDHLIMALDASFDFISSLLIVYAYFYRWKVAAYSPVGKANIIQEGFNSTLSFCITASIIDFLASITTSMYIASYFSYDSYVAVTNFIRLLNASLTPMLFFFFHTKIKIVAWMMVQGSASYFIKFFKPKRKSQLELDSKIISDMDGAGFANSKRSILANLPERPHSPETFGTIKYSNLSDVELMNQKINSNSGLNNTRAIKDTKQQVPVIINIPLLKGFIESSTPRSGMNKDPPQKRAFYIHHADTGPLSSSSSRNSLFDKE